jgi:hypothetical protein
MKLESIMLNLTKSLIPGVTGKKIVNSANHSINERNLSTYSSETIKGLTTMFASGFEAIGLGLLFFALKKFNNLEYHESLKLFSTYTFYKTIPYALLRYRGDNLK